MSNKTFKCPYCHKKYIEKPALYNHMDKSHKEYISEEFPPSRIYFNFINKKTVGKCTICGKETDWNEVTERYNRFCSEKCKKHYVEEFQKRMIKVHGKTTQQMLQDPDMQKKMLSNRKISGKYKWSDGSAEIQYVGSYELDFLKFLDLFMNFESEDIISPAPQTFYYDDNGTRRFYIPDFYIPSINTLVEVKDGQDNKAQYNNRLERDAKKEKLKDEIMRNQKEYNFVKVVNKDNSIFLNFLMELKNNTGDVEEKKENFSPIINISEAVDIAMINLKIISEDSKSFNLNETIHFSKLDKNFKKKTGIHFKYIDILSPTVIKYLKRDDEFLLVKNLERIRKERVGELVVDTDNDILAGYIFVTHNGHINPLYVFPEYRGYGLSKKLLKDAINKYNAISLNVRSDNAIAIKTYKDVGFDIVKEFKENEMLYMCLKGTKFFKDEKERLKDVDKYKSILNEDTLLNKDIKLYTISDSNLDGKTLSPRVPSNFLTKNGYEDSKTPRVCFSTSVSGCLTALSQNCKNKNYYVHIPEPSKNYKVYKPSKEEVPDATVTHEHWIKESVKLKCIGKIHCTGDDGKDGKKYTYGDGKKAELYGWEYKWVDKN